MFSYKNILKRIGKIIKKIMKLMMIIFILLITYCVAYCTEYYYIDGPKFIKQCLQKGYSLESCKSQYY